MKRREVNTHSAVSSLALQRLDYGDATPVPSDEADAVGDEFCCSACAFCIELHN